MKTILLIAIGMTAAAVLPSCKTEINTPPAPVTIGHQDTTTTTARTVEPYSGSTTVRKTTTTTY